MGDESKREWQRLYKEANRRWRDATDEIDRLRAALHQETRIALDCQKQRDEWKRQCDLASEAQADALSDATKARADLDDLRVELLEVQHEIGEGWFAGGVSTAEALRRKTMALEFRKVVANSSKNSSSSNSPEKLESSGEGEP